MPSLKIISKYKSRTMLHRPYLLTTFLATLLIFPLNNHVLGQGVETLDSQIQEPGPAEPDVADSIEDLVDEVMVDEVVFPPADESEAPELPKADKPVAEPTEIELPADLNEIELSDETPIEVEVDADNPGQTYLDQAVEIKITANSLKDLNQVIDLVDTALEEGLDAGNTDFAEQILVSSLMQRAGSLSGAVLQQPNPDPAQMNRALQLRMFALTDLQRAVSLDDDQYQAWMLIGRLQSLPGGNKSEARRAMTKVIQYAEKTKDDPSVESLSKENLSQAFALRGATQRNSARRLADFNQAVELEPEKSEYLILRAQAHQADKNPDRCIADLDKAIELAPTSAKAHELKALALLMQEKPEAALESFNRATELAPDSITPYQYRGELYSKMGKLDEAVAQLDRAIEIAPTNLASRLVRAELLLALAQSVEKPTEEEQLAELTEEAISQAAAIRSGLAKTYRQKALTDIESALQVRPGLVRAHVMRARVLTLLERPEEALNILEQLAKAAPDNLEIQFQLAAYYIDLGRSAAADHSLTKVLELDPENSLAIRLRGDMRLLIGDHAGAIEDFAIAREKGELDASVLNNYAWTLATSPYDEVRNGKLAVELATEACEETNYEQAHILSTLASAHAEAGNFGEAIKWAEKAVARAKELGEEDRYDGQLEAELESYRDGKPWRELQQESGTKAGPAGEEQPLDSNLKNSDDDASSKADAKETGEESDTKDTESRSLDF